MEHSFINKGKLVTSHEGLMLGNSSLGALIYGENKLTISLDLINLWDKRYPSEFYDKNFNYPYMVKCINEKNIQELYRLFDNCYSYSYPTKINACRIMTDIDVNDSSVFKINFDNGIFSFNNDKINIDGYISMTKDIFVINSDNKINFDFLLSAYFYKPLNEKGLGYKCIENIIEGDFKYSYIKMYKNKHFYVLSKEIKTIKGYKYYFTVIKDRSLKYGKTLINKYIKNEDNHIQENIKFWNDYYSKSNIVTPDSDINDLYIKGLYYFACNSSKKYPMTLHGVWTSNNDALPPWKSDLHNDINVEMTYDSYFKTGHFAQGKVLVDYLYSLRHTFKDFAKHFMKSKGLLIPGVMSQDGKPLGGWPQYALSPMVSIWILKVFDDYFCYTGDMKFLKKKSYYFFKESEKCISKYLIKDKDGYLMNNFHSSPEFYENQNESLFKNQTNFEITMLRYLYQSLVNYSHILNKDASYYESQLKLIRDYYRDSNGLLMISKDVNYDHSHRHFSHMLMYKNLKLVNPYIYKDVIKKDIDNLTSYGTSEWVGFSFVEASGLYSYLNDGENSYKNLKIYADAYVHPNGFHMNMDYKHLGYSTINCYVMTLEANMGFVSSLVDMLISDNYNVLTIFPSIPELFKKEGTSFKDLRITNNIKVSASIKDGVINYFKIYKEDGEFDLQLFNNIATTLILNVDDKIMLINSELNDTLQFEKVREIIYENNNH